MYTCGVGGCVCDMLFEHCKQFDTYSTFCLVLRTKKWHSKDNIFRHYPLESLSPEWRPKYMYLFLFKIKFVWNLLYNVITVIQDDLLDMSFMDHEGQKEGNNSLEPSKYLGELKIPFVINPWCLQRLHDQINVNSVGLERLSEPPIQKYPLFCSIMYFINCQHPWLTWWIANYLLISNYLFFLD